MKRLLCALAIALTLGMSYADAGSSTSGGGSRGGFSGGSVSSGSRGGFSSSPSVSAPSNRGSFSSAPAATAPRTTTTTTTTTRSTSSYHYSSPYVGGGVMYGGFGMAYPYTNGLLMGMIIGGMMHPHNTVVYTGPGVHSNNALLYPDGRVVNSSGYLIGTYTNGQFTPIQNGGMVAQQVPADAGQQQVQPQQQPVPIVIQNNGLSDGEFLLIGMLGAFLMMMVVFIVRIW